MKKIILLFLVCTLLNMNGVAQELNTDKKQAPDKMNQNYAVDKKAVSARYAWLLYRTGEEANYLKADSVLNQFISMQDDDQDAVTYGQWGWKWERGEKVVDFNNALFQADMMFARLWDHQSKMSADTKKNYLTSCQRLLEAAKRRWDTEVFDIGRDYVKYSNIFVLYVETLTLAGNRFNDSLLKKMAKSQWTRWYNHISYFGIDEFASTTYNHVIFYHLMNIRDFCEDERIQRECNEVLDHIYLLQSALTHPGLKLLASGVSRDYRLFLIQGDVRSEVLTASRNNYVPPQEAVVINKNRNYPFEVVGKASIMPFIFKSYQLEDAAMGSMTGGNCFQQQIHCITAVGVNENERAVVFIQGSNTPVNGFTDQKKTSTLCVYNRLPNYWQLTQWRGDMSAFRETIYEFGVGTTTNWQEKLNTPDHIVLEASGYDVHIFPFAIVSEKIGRCKLVKKHRTTTSPRYHPRPRIFDEYVFPPEPDWFGVFITLMKAGTDVTAPDIYYSNTDGIRTFKTDIGHQVRLFVTEKGETKQLFNVDPALIPLLNIIEY